MSISYGSVTFHYGSKSSLVVMVKEKQDSDLILLQLKGAVHQQGVEVFSRGEMVCFVIMVDYVFLRWES